MRRIKLIGALIIWVLCLPMVAGAQAPFKAIVLINGQAYVVDLVDNGSIINRYQKVDNYFQSTATDEALISEIIKGGLEPTSGIAFYDVEDNIESTVPASSILREKQYIQFSDSRAVLNKQAVDHVRKISDAYQERGFVTVAINAYHSDTPRTRTLAQNRAQAISDLLNTFGVPMSAIEIRLPFASDASDISFVNLSFTE